MEVRPENTTANPYTPDQHKLESHQRKQEMVQQQGEIRALATRDREVRAHEQAHAAVGGPHAGHPNYQYTQGPNGVRYASSGHVNIDISPVANDPQATLEKMQTVARAALAPAEPSPQDRAVAAKANQLAAEARAQIAQTQQEQTEQLLRSQERHEKAHHEMGGTSGSLLDLVV